MPKKCLFVLLTFSLLIMACQPLQVDLAAPAATISAPTPSASASVPIGSGDHQVSVQSAGIQREFLLHIPIGYQKGVHYPLVVALHGRGGTSAEMAEYTGFSNKADQEGFIVIYPLAVWENRTWMVVSGAGSLEDLTFVWDVITYAINGLGADPGRVYVAGFSNGAGMAHRLGCALAGKIAGIATVAGSYPVHENCAPNVPLPVIAFHGTADYFVPYLGDTIQPSIPEWASAWAARNGCQNEAIVIFDQDGVLGKNWTGCDRDVVVSLYTVAEGGHQWLGSPTYEGVGGVVRRINATDMIWDFFEDYP
jgi:polyhydroxybutyrate depolymerase